MKLNKEIILVDIDETSARTIEDWVYPIVNERYWTNFKHNTTHDYRDVFWNLINENWKLINTQRKIEIFNQSILQDRWKNEIRTVEWSVKKILELQDWYNTGMLTARHNILTEYTTQWVKNHYNWTISKVLFSNCFHWGKTKKSDICKEEWAKIMIEDDMDYAIEIAKEGILVFLLKRPWNEKRKEKHRNIKRIDSWDEINL